MSTVSRTYYRFRRFGVKVGLLLLGMTLGVSLPAQTITTVAGNGVNGFDGDNAAATTKGLRKPRGMAEDRAGNFYIADYQNQRVRRVDGITKLITTYAGTGAATSSGDSGYATAAGVQYPNDVAFDSSGNLYIASYFQHIIRKVSPGGIITTFAGVGTAGANGDGGPASSAHFNNPASLAFDRMGNLFVADYSNKCIRRIGIDGIVQTIAGGGGGDDGGPATAAALSNPLGITLDAQNNLYIADFTGHRIRKISAGADGVISGANDEIITTVAGIGTPGNYGDNGSARDAALNGPSDIAVDSLGNLFIADQNNNRIRKVDASTGVITTIAGTGDPAFGGDNGPAISAKLNHPYSLAFNASGDLYIADSDNNRIRKITGVAYFPSLKIEKIADFVVPTIPTASTTAPDVHLSADVGPIQVPVEISGINLPDGTIIHLLRNGAPTASGTMIGGKVTLSLDFPANPETGLLTVTLLQAVATVRLSLAALSDLPKIKGVTLMAMELTSSPGSSCKIEYLSCEGKRYTLSTLKAMKKAEIDG